MVNFSPLMPGLNDDEMAAVMAAAADHGARSISYTMLRLPLTVKPIFMDWLEHFAPSKKQRVENAIRKVRDGQLNASQFGARMRGSGDMADQFSSLFRILRVKYRLDGSLPELDRSQFQLPAARCGCFEHSAGRKKIARLAVDQTGAPSTIKTDLLYPPTP